MQLSIQGRGNCGFHAIAALAGYDENDWKTIRQIMLLELTSYASLYEKVLGGKERLDELHHRLNYFGDDPAQMISGSPCLIWVTS
ncbi:hypothetical protein Vadar_007495 [Vaccinium darrowii]|uniref:Uncharacterized protein n=1 Tax=Vaccinium darrowii TaxID=229202 RepID=A0ACB7XG19_9ERIC|nr:hypothetical protein Vadar_007495 [Vaccinium darrowii]